MRIFRNTLAAVCLMALLMAAESTKANLIDFGTSWPTFVSVGNGNYATAPYDRVIGVDPGQYNTETEIANFLNSVAGTTFTAADINKTASPTELGGSDGYFAVPSGWEYLVVKYDGSHAGSVVIELDGNAANVPFDSAAIWGGDINADKYAVSHFSVAGPVPDGGTTIALLGFALVGIGALRRKFSRN